MEDKRENVDNAFNSIMPLHAATYFAVNRFRSVRRAIRRGHIAIDGTMYPVRPFHNKANTCIRGKHSRSTNEEKKKIYASVREYRRRNAEC